MKQVKMSERMYQGVQSDAPLMPGETVKVSDELAEFLVSGGFAKLVKVPSKKEAAKKEE